MFYNFDSVYIRLRKIEDTPRSKNGKHERGVKGGMEKSE